MRHRVLVPFDIIAGRTQELGAAVPEVVRHHVVVLSVRLQNLDLLAGRARLGRQGLVQRQVPRQGQDAGQRCGVAQPGEQRHRRALAHVRGHGVCGVSDAHHAAPVPGGLDQVGQVVVNQFARVAQPREYGGHGAPELCEARAKAFEAAAFRVGHVCGCVRDCKTVHAVSCERHQPEAQAVTPHLAQAAQFDRRPGDQAPAGVARVGCRSDAEQKASDL